MRCRHPALVDEVFVNAEHGSEYGSDVERFLALVRTFNRRDKDATRRTTDLREPCVSKSSADAEAKEARIGNFDIGA